MPRWLIFYTLASRSLTSVPDLCNKTRGNLIYTPDGPAGWCSPVQQLRVVQKWIQHVPVKGQDCKPRTKLFFSPTGFGSLHLAIGCLSTNMTTSVLVPSYVLDCRQPDWPSYAVAVTPLDGVLRVDGSRSVRIGPVPS